MSEQIQHFLHISGNAFCFDNFKCQCKTGKDIDSNGNEHDYLMIRSIEEKLHFAYRPSIGIVLINKKGTAEAEPFLQKLLSIKSSDISSLQSFFEKYGFIVPVSSTVFERFEWSNIIEIIRRLKISVELLSKIQSEPSDIRAILGSTIILLFMKPVTIRPLSGDEFKSTPHIIIEHINNVMWGNEDDSNLNMFNSNNAHDHKYLIPDTITTSPFAIGYYQYKDAISTESTTALNYKEVVWNYKNKLNLPYEQRLIIDFLFHFQYEVVKIVSVTTNAIVYSTKDFVIPPYLHDALLQVAKHILKDEFEYSMGAISPLYDVASMSGTWSIPDLISGLYFSIFYMQSKISVLRKCANPNCINQSYFEVSTTNSRKKFCCIDCANAVAQHNYRLKHKIKK